MEPEMEHPSLLLTNVPLKRLQRELKEISKYESSRKLMKTIKIIMSDISLFLCSSHKLKGSVTKEVLWIATCDQFFGGFHPTLEFEIWEYAETQSEQISFTQG